MMNRKGFTLIELLVTIALMLSLLGVAIVSFINVSDRKKKESYEQVKVQIETAAELYFSTNPYLFEGLEENATGSITVGKLVGEDYLNRVVNPTTGKQIPYCSYVEVTKKGNKFDKEFVDSNSNDKNCDTKKSITISEPGAPKIVIVDPYQAEGTTKYETPYEVWFGDKVNFKLTAVTNNNGPITRVERCNTMSDYCINYEEVSNYGTVNGKVTDSVLNTPTSGSKATTCYKVTNNSGKSAIMCGTANVDISKPECKTSSSNSGWSASNVVITGKCTDTGAGCKADSISKTITTKGESHNSPGSVKDNVGHETACPTVLTKIDNIKPVCSAKVEGGTSGNNGWYKRGNAPVVKFTAEDKESGISGASTSNQNVTEGNKSYSATFKDNAGNSVTCSSNVKWDNANPTCSLTSSGTEGNNGWYRSYITVSFSSKNDANGISNYGIEGWNGQNSRVQSWEGQSTWPGYVMDVAGNEGSCTTTVKADWTPPVYDDAAGGRLRCVSGGKDHSWGYSINYHDAISTSTAYLLEYYSSVSCDSFYWAGSSAKDINDRTSPKTLTVFARCSNNPSPRAKFKLVDEAGNESNVLEVVASKDAIGSSTPVTCDQGQWYTSNR